MYVDLGAELLESFEPGLGPRAMMEVNTAMLDFAKRLPLDELGTIGREPASPISYAVKHDVSSHHLEVHANIFVTPNSYTPSRALRLSSINSGTSWSFVCRSAQRLEQEREEIDDDDDASSFGSLTGWGVANYGQTVSGITNKGPLRNEPSALPSPTEESDDSYQSFLRYIDVSDDDTSCPMMSKEEFDALPDWSDVEDDPLYNTPFPKQRFAWSSTASSASLDNEAGEVNMDLSATPSEYPAAFSSHPYGKPVSPAQEHVGQANIATRVEKRKRNESQELDSSLKRAKFTELKLKRRLPPSSRRRGRKGGLPF